MIERIRELSDIIREGTGWAARERHQLLVELHDAHKWTDKQIAEAVGTITRATVQAARSGRTLGPEDAA